MSDSAPTNWSSANSNFNSPATFTTNAPSWGYSESKLADATKNKPSFGGGDDEPGSSATRREEFDKPPRLPSL